MIDFTEFHNTKVMSHRNGKRLWLEGARPNDSGFAVGARYSVKTDGSSIIFKVDPNGDRTVSKKNKNGVLIPIIDYRLSSEHPFELDDRLTALFSENTIVVTIHHERQRKLERERDFIDAIRNNRVTEGSLCTGGGISTAAVHLAVNKAGIESKLAYVVDESLRYLQVAGKNNFAIDDDTRFVVSKLEELPLQLLPKVNILSFSLPCAGHSKSGAAKHKQSPEAHSSATSLFGLINVINQSNPSVLWSENVAEAKDGAMYVLLKAELKRRGYRIVEDVTANEKTSSLEARKRYWFMAVSDALPASLTEGIFEYKVKTEKKCLNDIRDVFADSNEANWREHTYLKEKQIRDELAGKGFTNRQLIIGTEHQVGTIGRFVAKRRSTEPFWVRPDGKERLFSVKEHSAVKQVPYSLVSGCSDTLAHEILGQSIDFMQGFMPMHQLMINCRNLLKVDYAFDVPGAAKSLAA